MAGYGAGACIALLRTGAVLRVASLVLEYLFSIELMRDSLAGGAPARWFVIFRKSNQSLSVLYFLVPAGPTTPTQCHTAGDVLHANQAPPPL